MPKFIWKNQSTRIDRKNQKWKAKTGTSLTMNVLKYKSSIIKTVWNSHMNKTY